MCGLYSTIRGEAAAVLNQMGKGAKGAVANLNQGLQDSDPVVGKLTTSALSQVGSSAG